MVDHYSASARTGNNVKAVFKALTERKYFVYLLIFRIGIVISKAANKANKSTKMVSRGMLNVKGIDLDDEDNDGGVQLRSSEYKNRKPKKNCAC